MLEDTFRKLTKTVKELKKFGEWRGGKKRSQERGRRPFQFPPCKKLKGSIDPDLPEFLRIQFRGIAPSANAAVVLKNPNDLSEILSDLLGLGEEYGYGMQFLFIKYILPSWDAYAYRLRLVDSLFTKEELGASLLFASKKSQKPGLKTSKVEQLLNLIKNNMGLTMI